MKNDLIESRGGRHFLSKEAAGFRVPETIRGIISARIDRLEGPLKRTLQVASVIGRKFSFRVLEAVSEYDGEELKSILLSLQDMEFVYEESLLPELIYQFKHPLTREVAYNNLLISKRKEILKKERAFNEAAGLTPADDRPPEFMRYEKLPPHNQVFDVPDEALDSVWNF